MSRSSEYDPYIRSAAWRVKADAAKVRAGYRCQGCSRHSTQVHLDAYHRTVDRLGNERDDDITVLCRDCHRLFERNKWRRKQPASSVSPPPEFVAIVTTPRKSAHFTLQATGPAHSPTHAGATKRRSPLAAWMIASVAGGYLLWTMVVSAGTTQPAPIAAIRTAVAPRAPVAHPATLASISGPTPPSDPVTMLAVSQAARHAGEAYTTTCPHTWTTTNLRTGSSTEQTQVIAVLPPGTCLPISAQTPDGRWFALNLDREDHTTVLAWVFADLVVDPPSSLPNLAPQSAPRSTSHP